MNKKYQSGNIVAYILIGFVLLGLLAATLRGGPDKDPGAARLEQMTNMFVDDLKTIGASISECAQMHPGKVDANGDGVDDHGNLNVPFPVYGDMSSGGAGDDIMNIRCPNASPEQQPIFNLNLRNRLNLLGDTNAYMVYYMNDATNGVYLNISEVVSSGAWTEILNRVNNRFARCAFGIDTGQAYYFFKRRSTSTVAPEASCPEPN